MNAAQFGFAPKTGDMVRAKGNVTLLSQVFGETASKIEKKLGFRTGRLHQGWALLFLIEAVEPADFVWEDTTKFSGGWKFDKGLGEYVRMSDFRRAGELRKTALTPGVRLSDEQIDRAADRLLADFQESQSHLLGTRHGTHRICKVVPVITPWKGRRAWYYEYPESRVKGVPQWELVKAKHMKCVAVIPPGGVFSDRMAR